MIDLIKKYSRFLKYGIISVIITIIDVIVVRLLYLNDIKLVYANTAGMITGSIVQFILNSKFTFKNEINLKYLIYHFGTFLFGVWLANTIIDFSYNLLLKNISEVFSFYIAKGLSIILPFFVLYFIRAYLFNEGNDTLDE